MCLHADIISVNVSNDTQRATLKAFVLQGSYET